MTFNRRQFLTAGSALTASAALAQPSSPLPFLITVQSDPLLPKAIGKRVVVCGGGWGGITAAKYLKKLDPTLEEGRPGIVRNPQKNRLATCS